MNTGRLTVINVFKVWFILGLLLIVISSAGIENQINFHCKIKYISKNTLDIF